MTKSRLGKVWTFFMFFNIYEKRVYLNFDTPSLSDPPGVTKIFIVTCATDSYEMCFCDTVPQIVVHFDLSGAKSGTKTASFYRS